MTNTHSFHIPVMGLAFTIDSPFKVSQYGIDSVVSLCDDALVEKMRKVYSEYFEVPYQEITNKIVDFRAKRITSYLNLINDQTTQKFEEFKVASAETIEDIKTFFDILPNTSAIKSEFTKLISSSFDFSEITDWLKNNLPNSMLGSIDVNIMTKLDKDNYRNGVQLPVEYNDAHAAFRGFAESDLEASIILSAGMNPRLYAYINTFKDFYPTEEGYLKKKIILKVSDYRSALIQGKYLAKRGIWISEYRIESGLNCGGHAFATDGYLMGPILDEFKNNKENLIKEVHDILVVALKEQNKPIPYNPLELKITAQGGVGTHEEHEFLLNHYNVDAVGWGTPFLLVPEATTVDDITLKQLADAKENELYLSNISPLGVPFNSLKGDTKEIEKLAKVAMGKPGSSCPKEHLQSNIEFSDIPICTASRQYQRKKIKELEQEEISDKEYANKFTKIIEKACLCVGLGTSALINNNVERKVEGDAVVVCPGPNMAYFSSISTLKDMIGHIYGKNDVGVPKERPNMFMKEMGLYFEYLKSKITHNISKKDKRYLGKFTKNMNDGINYYQTMFGGLSETFGNTKSKILAQLDLYKTELSNIEKDIEEKSQVATVI